MIFKNLINKKDKNLKRYCYDDFSKIKYDKMENVLVDEDGNIKPFGHIDGGKTVNVGEGYTFQGCFSFTANDTQYVFIYRNDGKLLYSTDNGNTFTLLSDITFTGLPVAVKTEKSADGLVVISDDTTVAVFDGTSLTTLAIPPFKDGKCFCDMLATVPYDNGSCLLISSPKNQDITFGLDAIVCFTFKGNIKGLFVKGNALFVFTENEIYKVTPKDERKNYDIKEVCATCHKIFENSVVKVGDDAVFLTKSGIFRFDGTKIIKQTFFRKKEDVLISLSTACSYDGKYYLFGNKSLQNAVSLCYDGVNNCGGVYFNYPYLPVKNIDDGLELYVCSQSKIFKFDKSCSSNLNVGYKFSIANADKQKTYGVSLEGENISVTVESGNVQKTVYPEDDKIYHARVYGNRITVTVNPTSSNFSLEKLNIYFKED